MKELTHIKWWLFATLFLLHSCANKDEHLRKEIIGSYSFTQTDDKEEGVFVTISGASVFKENGICENTGTMTISVIDEYGDKSTLKYKIEVYAKYEIKNSDIIYDYKLENIGITLMQSDNRALSKLMQDHYIPQMKHEMITNNKEKILELTDKYLKTEEDVDGEKIILTHIRLTESPKLGIWKTMTNNLITNTSIAGVEVVGKTIREIKSHLNPALTYNEYNEVKNGETLLFRFHTDVQGVIYSAWVYDTSYVTAEGLHVGNTSGDLLKLDSHATVCWLDVFAEYTVVNGITYFYDHFSGDVGNYSNNTVSKIVDKNVKIDAININGNRKLQ